MKSKLKTELLYFLEEDEDVINAVKRIIGSEGSSFEPVEKHEKELLQKIKELNEKLALITQQKVFVEKAYDKQKAELERKEIELAEIEKEKENDLRERKETIEKYNDLKLRYAEFDAIYNKYLELGDSVIIRMERILNRSAEVSGTPEIFMAYGIQENNIVALWESIATNFDFYDSYGKTQDLIDIFQYFLELYKEITFKSILIEWPKSGDSYDERIHTRTSSSNAVGKIQKVILPRFSIGKNITKKALVIVK